MNKGLLYSNGVVSSLSQNLLTKDFLSRLSDCTSLNEVQEILEETSFNFSQEETTINEKMQIETIKLINFVKTESPDDKFVQFFLLPFDYENLQTFCKCSILNIDAKNYIKTEGLYSYDQIKNSFLTKNYSSFNNLYVEKALKYFNKLSQDKSLNGWEIEFIFKKAMYENLLKISISPILNKLIKNEITIENISMSIRAKTQFELESQTLPGGYLNKENLLQIFNRDKSILNINVDRSILPFIKIAISEKTNDTIIKFEKNRQLFKLKYFSENKNNIETISPFAYYCYSLLNDIKNIRLAYSFIENGQSKEIKKRILSSEK